jgi:hypothetical protein
LNITSKHCPNKLTRLSRHVSLTLKVGSNGYRADVMCFVLQNCTALSWRQVKEMVIDWKVQCCGVMAQTSFNHSRQEQQQHWASWMCTPLCPSCPPAVTPGTRAASTRFLSFKLVGNTTVHAGCMRCVDYDPRVLEFEGQSQLGLPSKSQCTGSLSLYGIGNRSIVIACLELQ